MVIFILKLQQNKYYVGQTKCLTATLNEYRAGSGSSWLSKYKMINCAKTFKSNSNHDQYILTLLMMKRYGIENVRSSCFDNIYLTEHQQRMIKHKITSNIKMNILIGKFNTKQLLCGIFN